jgi:hypothetical protein
VPGHQRRARHRARHQKDRDERDEERQRQRHAEAQRAHPAALQKGEAVLQFDAAPLEGHRRQLLREEEAGDAEADHRDHRLPDDRDETAGEEQHAVADHAQHDPQRVPGGDPQFTPERQSGVGHVAALGAVDLLGEVLVEGLADQERHGREGDDGHEQSEGEQQCGERAAEDAEPGRGPVVGERGRPGRRVVGAEDESDECGRVEHQGHESGQQAETEPPAVAGDPALALHQVPETRPEITHTHTLSGCLLLFGSRTGRPCVLIL